jgi:hypothetical protein
MKRIIAVSLVALFVLLGSGLALACPFQDTGTPAGPTVQAPQTNDNATATTTPQLPADQTQQPNG